MSQELRKSPQNFLSATLDGEVVLVHGSSGVFYSLKDTGLAIWKELDRTGDLEEVADALCREFTIDRDTCEREIGAFADQLVREGFATFH